MADAAPPKPQASGSTLWMFLLLAGALLIMFDERLRNALSTGVGYVFMPLFGFGGEYPVWTIFIVGLVMVVASTLVRHFFVDWTAMARAQETMKQYQKELKAAREANNTYKMKRLTDAQPEILKMQAELSGGQMKPMIITMIVVIPLFAWVAGFVATPVEFEARADGGADAVIVAMTGQAAGATVTGGSLGFVHASDVYALPLENATGEVHFVRPSGVDYTAPLTNAPMLDLSAHRLDNVTLAPGTYRFQKGGYAEVAGYGHLDRYVVVAQGNTTRAAFVVDVTERTHTFTEPVALHVLVPVHSADATRGNRWVRDVSPFELFVTPQGGERATYDITAEHAVDVTRFPHTRVVPHAANVPWEKDWDLNMNIQWDFFPFNIIPRWIALYSLFSIPFGQALQKALKMWEYRRKARATVAG